MLMLCPRRQWFKAQLWEDTAGKLGDFTKELLMQLLCFDWAAKLEDYVKQLPLGRETLTLLLQGVFAALL